VSKWILVFVTLLSMLIGVHVWAARDGVDLLYTVEVVDPALHRAHITIDIRNTSTLQEISLFIKTTKHLHYLISICNDSTNCPSLTYETHISNFKVYNDKGRLLRTYSFNYAVNEAEVINERRISVQRASSIRVEYDVVVLYPSVYGEGEVRTEAYLGTDYGIINEDFFFYRPDVDGSWTRSRRVQVRSIQVVFKLPVGWKAISVWAGDSMNFKVDDPGSFCTRCKGPDLGVGYCKGGPFLGLGPYKVISRRIGDTDVVVAVLDREDIPAQKIARLVFYSFERFHELVGSYLGERFVSFTISDYYEGASGIRAMRHILSGPRLRSSIVWNYRIDNEAWLMYPDELFWEWIEELGFMSKGKDKGRAYWFTDGAIVNTYYKIPYELGYTTEADYYGEYVRCRRLYDEDGSHLAPLLALALDQEIQEETDGAKTLQDVIAVLHEMVGSRLYTNYDVQRALEEVTGSRFTEFFNRYVYPSKAPPLPVLDEYQTYPDLEIRAETVTWQFLPSGDIFVEVPVFNYGPTGALASVEFYVGYPWSEGKLIASDSVTVPAMQGDVAGRAVAKCYLKNGNTPLTLFVQISSVSPGDIDTRRLQKLRVLISKQPEERRPPTGYGCESGEPFPVNWSSAKLLSSQSKDNPTNPNLDITALYAYDDGEFLYVRLEFRGTELDCTGNRFRYEIYLTSPSWGKVGFKIVASEGELGKAIDWQVVESWPIDCYIGKVVEVAVPFSYLPQFSELRILGQSRVFPDTVVDVIEGVYRR